MAGHWRRCGNRSGNDQRAFGDKDKTVLGDRLDVVPRNLVASYGVGAGRSLAGHGRSLCIYTTYRAVYNDCLGGSPVVPNWRYRDKGLAIISVFLLSIFMITTWVQAKYWKESITLYQHAVDVTANNDAMHYNLGVTYAEQVKFTQAIRHYREALRIDPDFSKAYNNLGLILITQGKIGGAITCFKEALRIDPGFSEAQINLKKTLDF
ncbi:hypothetical protein C6A37_04850 [Desulfobacteraceae bacterium SEEP-SAG9]|nr:hypothetical protein C6A37_04850 [Desulfobacteraceae bacterium SEEP-SAG9]